MSMGGPGDHPLTDFLNHGYPVFPADMRPMIRKLHSIDAHAFDALPVELYDWEAGKNLDAGRDLLRSLLLRHGIDPSTL
jgi:hypothetical protein